MNSMVTEIVLVTVRESLLQSLSSSLWIISISSLSRTEEYTTGDPADTGYQLPASISDINSLRAGQAITARANITTPCR